MPLPEDDRRIRLEKTAFVIYTHSDTPQALAFMEDFGLKVKERRGSDIFMEGYGGEPFLYWLKVPQVESQPSSFNGAAYVVESRRELEKAARLPSATSISPLPAPGGGEWVTLVDPLGFPVHLVHGQAEKDVKLSAPTFPDHRVNYEREDQKPRRGEFLRLHAGKAWVHKWGHYGFTYPEGRHDEVFDWYTSTLALAASDQLHRDGKTIVTFFHIDRAKDFTDHHCFFIKPAKVGDLPSVAHAAFEVHDFDTQQLGHQYLLEKGHKLCWGVGRHVLGSQVFDYWFDTSGFVVEHYCDGDLVNEDSQVSYGKAGPQSLKIWGPPVPTVF